MAYWLVSLSEDNFLICMKLRKFGGKVRRKGTFKKMQSGDRVVFYVSRKYVDHQIPKVSQFRGTGTIIGEAFLERERIWHGVGNEVYPIRMRFKPDISQGSVELRDIAGNLDFIPSGNAWTLAFFNTPRTIPGNDLAKIEKALKKSK